jgi:hypothetical protein
LLKAVNDFPGKGTVGTVQIADVRASFRIAEGQRVEAILRDLSH